MSENIMPKFQVYTPAHIANYFLSEPNHMIDNLKLNKLVYIAYGYCLALLNDKDENKNLRRIFHESIQAWKFGPVIPSIYHEFKTFRFNRIDALSIIYDYGGKFKEYIPRVNDNDGDVLDILSQVYERYGEISSMELVNLTHEKGTPWQETYELNSYNLEITDERIKGYYEKQFRAGKLSNGKRI